MNATAVAALIAAVSFAVVAAVGVYVMLRLARLLTERTKLVSELRGQGDALFARANAAVDRASEQLDRADAVAASMDELGAGMSELAGQVSALAGLGRAIASGPVGRAAALAYGVRHAVILRSRDPRGAIGPSERVMIRRELERATANSAGRSPSRSRAREGPWLFRARNDTAGTPAGGGSGGRAPRASR